MKLIPMMCTAALLTAAFAADPAATNNSSMKTISEKAAAAHQEALAIAEILKAKSPDMAAAAARAETLDKHVADLQEAAQNGSDEKIKASVDVLKVLTENKAKQLAAGDSKERDRFRQTAKNIAMRAEQILKSSRRIGS